MRQFHSRQNLSMRISHHFLSMETDSESVKVPSEKEIKKYISFIDDQLKIACNVLLQWNNAIINTKPLHIRDETKYTAWLSLIF